jgi:hypothetical protein
MNRRRNGAVDVASSVSSRQICSKISRAAPKKSYNDRTGIDRSPRPSAAGKTSGDTVTVGGSGGGGDA